MQTRNSQLSTLNSQLGRVADGNPTAEAIISRLPDKPVVNAREIADALDMTGISAVTGAVDEGKLHAVKIGGQYRVARAEAARWIRSLGA